MSRRVLGAILVLCLAGGGFGALRWADSQLSEPHAFGAPATGQTIEVAAGTSSRAILEQLERDGVLASAWLARLYLSRFLGDPPLQAGEYHFRSPISTREVLAALRAGDVVTHPVTLIEGLTYLESAEVLERAGFASRASLVAEFSSPARVLDLDPAAKNLEGFLFPDTYRFARGTPVAAIANALVGRFRAVWQAEVAGRGALAGDRSAREILILASLVEKEARFDDERALIAAVYANRLRRNIGLYADPTIIYGLKLAGKWDGDIRRRDLEDDSPWNSYLHAGLPPGPICSPGASSLAAAASPAAVDHLYFVSRNDGTHAFSGTLAEHNRNVDLWQRRYFRQGRQRKP